MGSGFTDAVNKGIPWISVVSGVVPARGLYDYGTNGFALAKIIDTYLIRTMRAKGGTKPHKLFAIGAPTVGVASANSSKQLERDVAAAGDVRLINHDLDLSNAVQDTLSTTRQALQQNPDLAGMWTLCDFCLPLMAQEVGKGTDRNPHDRRGRFVREPAGDRRHPQRIDRRRIRPSLGVVRLDRDGSGPAKHRA